MILLYKIWLWKICMLIKVFNFVATRFPSAIPNITHSKKLFSDVSD